MKCRFCNYEIPAADIELSQRLAKCRGCNQVFALDVPNPAMLAPGREKADAARLPSRPEKLKVVAENGQGYMQWRWFHPAAFALLFFCIAWDSFIFAWYGMALFGGANAPGPFNWLMIVFPIGHVAAGVGLTYFTLALFLNRTQIIFDGLYVMTRTGPMPFFRNRIIPKDDIQGFESEMRAQAGRSGTPNSYQLFVVVHDNTRKSLISFASDPALIRYTQRQLEVWLKLSPGRIIS